MRAAAMEGNGIQRRMRNLARNERGSRRLWIEAAAVSAKHEHRIWTLSMVPLQYPGSCDIVSNREYRNTDQNCPLSDSAS